MSHGRVRPETNVSRIFLYRNKHALQGLVSIQNECATDNEQGFFCVVMRVTLTLSYVWARALVRAYP